MYCFLTSLNHYQNGINFETLASKGFYDIRACATTRSNDEITVRRYGENASGRADHEA